MYSRVCNVIFLFSCNITAVLSGYTIKNATSDCTPGTLAIPAIVHTVNGPVINDSVPIQNGDIVAVGYIQTYASFQNIGCTRISNLQDEIDEHRTYRDPGQCYSACGTMYFGIYRSWCYCLTSSSGYEDEHCRESCSYPVDTVCGRRRNNGKTYASVYEYITVDGRDDESGGYCKLYHTDNKTFHWGNCSIQHRGMCQSGDLIDLKTWREFSKKCFEKDSRPVYETEVSDIGDISFDNGEDVWIGKIRSWTIRQTNETSVGGPVKYGYISIENETIKLKFMERIPNKVLCFEDPVDITTTVNTMAQTSISDTTAISATPTNNNESTVSTRPTAAEVITERQSGTPEEDSSSGLVAVYVIVPLVLVVAAAVVLVFVYRRKLTTKNQEEKKPDLDKHQQSVCQRSNDVKGVTNASYSKEFPATQSLGDNQGHDYFNLEPSNEYADILDDNTENNTNDDYDTTSAVNNQPRLDGDTGNVYNVFEKQESDTYNYVENDTLRKIKEQEQTGEIYDHISNGEEYSTPAGKDLQFDDTYNHAN